MPLIVGLLAFLGVLVGNAITHFIGEDYKRHGDATALAAAFWGELKGHFGGTDELQPLLDYMKHELAANQVPDVNVRAVEVGSDPVFDANVGKIGALGPELAAETAYVYQKLSGIRITLTTMASAWREMEDHEKIARLRALLANLEDARQKGKAVLPKLNEFAGAGTLPGWWRAFTKHNLPSFPSKRPVNGSTTDRP